MTWTYSGNPAASSLDAVRFHIQDTVVTAPLLSDEEITYLLAQESSVYAAAAAACRTLATQFARQPASRSIGDTSISYGEMYKRYTELASTLTSRSSRSTSVPTPHLTSLLQADKDVNNEREDLVRPSFPDDEDWSHQGTGVPNQWGE